jgi:hypothetical protein
MTVSNAYLKTVFNLLVTCLMWLYFTVGFALFFSWFYTGAYLFSKEREYAFQRVNHYFFRGFFIHIIKGTECKVTHRNIHKIT